MSCSALPCFQMSHGCCWEKLPEFALESDCWVEAYLLALSEESAWIVGRKDKMKCPLGTRLSVSPVELSSLEVPA